MRIDIGELIILARAHYKLDEKYWDLTPKVYFGDYGDGPDWESIYLDVQKKPLHRMKEWEEKYEI